MKKIIRLIAIAFVACLGFAGINASSVFAEDTEKVGPDAPPILIQVSPVSTQVILESGKTKEYTMIVRNSGTSDFSYHLYATPYSVADENYNIDFSTETPRTQVARWIKFYQGDKLVDKPTFNIKSGETQNIKYVVQIPENIPDGGQYAAIFAETDANKDGEGNSTGSGIRTASRVGMIIYGRTNGNTTEKGTVTDFNIPGFLVSGNISATSKVKNSGNTDFEAEYTLTVKSILGAELYNKKTTYNVLPDVDIERRVNLEWPDTPFMGIFKVYYKVVTPGEDGTMEEEKLVIKFPIAMIILTILVLTGLTIGIIMTVRKRKERKARLAV
ncbi:MAG: hypothetical protein Q4A25_01980 [Candidatus Saccharibacteria bacterium]|nr:hypothetical protein [Candidatus Saccharibacteria bacterium]